MQGWRRLYAIPGRIHSVAVATTDDGPSVAFHRLVQWRVQIDALADSRLPFSPIDHALVFGGSALVWWHLGRYSNRRIGRGIVGRPFSHTLSTPKARSR